MAKSMTENQFVKSLPIEDQPGYDPDKDPNLLRRIKYYQGESLGADFDIAIAEEDKALKKLGRDPANILQRNRKVQPLVPKRATTKQMTELKGKIDKYKKVHFPKEEKPFTKKANNLGKNKRFKKESFKLDPLPQIDFSTIAPPKQRTPEEIAMEQRFNELLKKSEDEKFRNATTGLALVLLVAILILKNRIMNKYELKYMLEQMSSSVDRLTDVAQSSSIIYRSCGKKSA